MSDNIRLVIEIPVEMFHEIRDTELISIETLNTSIKAIENGIPLSDVLNNVKAEVRNSSFDVTERSSGEQITLNYTVNVLDILDNISKEGEEI